jgi:hypothetical protein
VLAKTQAQRNGAISAALESLQRHIVDPACPPASKDAAETLVRGNHDVGGRGKVPVRSTEVVAAIFIRAEKPAPKDCDAP